MSAKPYSSIGTAVIDGIRRCRELGCATAQRRMNELNISSILTTIVCFWTLNKRSSQQWIDGMMFQNADMIIIDIITPIKKYVE
jgi:hypothetical protein